MDFPLNIVIFHSYVNLPEGRFKEQTKKGRHFAFWPLLNGSSENCAGNSSGNATIEWNSVGHVTGRRKILSRDIQICDDIWRYLHVCLRLSSFVFVCLRLSCCLVTPLKVKLCDSVNYGNFAQKHVTSCDILPGIGESILINNITRKKTLKTTMVNWSCSAPCHRQVHWSRGLRSI